MGISYRTTVSNENNTSSEYLQSDLELGETCMLAQNNERDTTELQYDELEDTYLRQSPNGMNGRLTIILRPPLSEISH